MDTLGHTLQNLRSHRKTQKVLSPRQAPPLDTKMAGVPPPPLGGPASGVPS